MFSFESFLHVYLFDIIIIVYKIFYPETYQNKRSNNEYQGLKRCHVLKNKWIEDGTRGFLIYVEFFILLTLFLICINSIIKILF